MCTPSVAYGESPDGDTKRVEGGADDCGDTHCGRRWSSLCGNGTCEECAETGGADASGHNQCGL
eukprot:9074369-Pyramimonas_sp.AAC.1